MSKLHTALSNPRKAARFLGLYLSELDLLLRNQGVRSPIHLLDLLLPVDICGSLLERQEPNSRTVQREILGNEMLLDKTDPGISRDLIVYGVREQTSAQTFRQRLDAISKAKRDPVVIEVGANIGYYLLQEGRILADHDGNGHIHAFEPSPDNVDLLKQNVALNDFDEMVTVNQAAVGPENGTAELAISDHSNFHRIASPTSAHENKQIPVDVWSLDEYITDLDIPHDQIAAVRMDVEGYELEVLRGMRETLKKETEFLLFIEVHPNQLGSDRLNELLSLLRGNDFELVTAFTENISAKHSKNITRASCLNDLKKAEYVFCLIVEKHKAKDGK